MRVDGWRSPSQVGEGDVPELVSTNPLLVVLRRRRRFEDQVPVLKLEPERGSAALPELCDLTNIYPLPSRGRDVVR